MGQNQLFWDKIKRIPLKGYSCKAKLYQIFPDTLSTTWQFPHIGPRDIFLVITSDGEQRIITEQSNLAARKLETSTQ